MYWDISKEIWDKSMNYHEGDNKVKKVKLQVYKMQFESLNMNEDKDIAKLFLCIDGIVNTIRGIDETMDDSFVVQKVLRSLPTRFNAEVSTIEEM